MTIWGVFRHAGMGEKCRRCCTTLYRLIRCERILVSSTALLLEFGAIEVHRRQQ